MKIVQDNGLLLDVDLVAEKKKIASHNYPRKELAEFLFAYNQQIGNDKAALENCQKLAALNSFCIVTGQQLGLMGGPSYTILKAITCLMAAREYNAIPIFWLATEDHDISEINHTVIVNALGNLQYFHLPLPKDGTAVEDLTLSEHSISVISDFLKTINKTEWLPTLTPGASYAHIMASFLSRLFANTGLVFLEPKLLRPLARSFFKTEILKSKEIESLLHKSSEKIRDSGEQPPLAVNSTNLFLKNDRGLRKKIKREEGLFFVDKDSNTEKQLLDIAETNPERFSTNVAARPLMQSALIPTLAYVSGPNENEYFKQLKDYFDFHHVPMPTIIPRLSATFIPAHAHLLLEKIGLNPAEPLPLHWDELFLELQSLPENQRKEIVHSKGIPYNALHLLRNLLHPNEKPQERVLNGAAFIAESEENLVHYFLTHANWKNNSTIYCYL